MPNIKQYADLDFMGISRLLNLPTPNTANEAATKGYVDSVLEGLSWKQSAKTVATIQISISSPGTSTIGGASLNVLDRVLLIAQTLPEQNGLYVFNGPSSAMTRTLDANTAGEVNNAIVPIQLGDNAGKLYRQTSNVAIIDTDAQVWEQFANSAPAASETQAGIAELATLAEVQAGVDTSRIVTPATLRQELQTGAYGAKRYAASIGNGSATEFVVTHNLNTTDVQVQVKSTATLELIAVQTDITNANAVTITFPSAPASNEFRVMVLA